MHLDTTRWSGEGTFTQTLIDRLQHVEGIDLIRVEDAPATRSDADYNFISNEIFVSFATESHSEASRRFGIFPATRTITSKAMTLTSLESALAAIPDVGAPDYTDESMMQYLRTERIIPPYQTRGYKL